MSNSFGILLLILSGLKFRYYLTAPAIKIDMQNTVNPGSPITIVTVPSHLYHILFELFKVK